jgi:hypothetical protein
VTSVDETLALEIGPSGESRTSIRRDEFPLGTRRKVRTRFRKEAGYTFSATGQSVQCTARGSLAIFQMGLINRFGSMP